ncbi:MAG: fumarate hydratase [Desulfuromonas sp. SDB]|nr:MAG: fumarate hydratase [Desulfuromonas sp. SDB]
MGAVKINTPLNDEVIKTLNIGMEVYLSGIVYTARDAAHKKLLELIDKNEQLPFDIQGSVIYYVGPSPAKPGQPIGAAGPTTSYRMDPFVPAMFEAGMKGMIGKGQRSQQVIDYISKYTGVYFGATGGAAALLAKSVKAAEVIAFPELGAEAIRKLEVQDMPLIVINDCYGKDLYQQGRSKWAIK